MLEVPLFGHNILAEPVQLLLIVNQLPEKVPQIPLHNHPTYIEDDRFHLLSQFIAPQTATARTPVWRRADDVARSPLGNRPAIAN